MQAVDLGSQYLELEVTENLLSSGHDFVKQPLAELKEMGVSIAIDGFGTGYSSLSHLRQYDFDVLKIDKRFVQGITDDVADKKLVYAIIQMAHAMGIKVVAEGVESQEQLGMLCKVSCDAIQGPFYSRPLTEDGLVNFLNCPAKHSPAVLQRLSDC